MYKKKTPWEQRRIRRDIVQISAVQTFRIYCKTAILSKLKLNFRRSIYSM
jgi:hypothetical protein